MEKVKTGCSTELDCMAALMKLGYIVSIPYGDCAPYDIVADVGNRLLKIQVKSSSELPGGKGFQFRTTNPHGVDYKTSVDAFMTTFDGNVYFVPIGQCSNKVQKLWFRPPNKGCSVKYASEYLLAFQLCDNAKTADVPVSCNSDDFEVF